MKVIHERNFPCPVCGASLEIFIVGDHDENKHEEDG